jgi:hypothetical protein
LKEEALECTVWRAGFGRGFEPVARQNAKGINIHIFKKSTIIAPISLLHFTVPIAVLPSLHYNIVGASVLNAEAAGFTATFITTYQTK